VTVGKTIRRPESGRRRAYETCLLVACLAGLLACESTVAMDEGDPNPGNSQPTDLDIYLLIGQSNMAGRAEIELEDRDPLDGAYLYTGESGDEWRPAGNPLNRYSTVRKTLSLQKLNPGYTFARVLAQASGGREIGLVVNARGGTGIALWAPGTEYFEEAVRQTRRALRFGTLKGVAWHQGEADISRWSTYTPKVIALIEAIRDEFNSPTLPFVVGQLSEDRPSRIPFNEMIIDLPSFIDHVGVATTEGTTTFDSTHFDSASQRVLGERYAAVMLGLMGG